MTLQYRGGKSSAADMAIRRKLILETGFRYFSQHGIENASMKEIAKEAGVGIATMFRYFNTKMEYVLAISTWKWQQSFQESLEHLQQTGLSSMTAAQRYEFYLNTFVDMYRRNRDLLRFNQFFNIYVQSEENGEAHLQRYVEMIDAISDRFASTLDNMTSDGTMRQDVPPKKVFSVSLHLMLAVATRFAVGLVYQPESAMSPEEELLLLKQMLLATYTQPQALL